MFNGGPVAANEVCVAPECDKEAAAHQS